VRRTRVVRTPVVAGTFYPSDALELAATVDALLERATSASAEAPTPVALVAPHAGYVYSGPIAASAFAVARNARRVVLLGPSHFVPLHGLAVSGADAWETPLGSVPVEPELREAALAAGAVVDDAPHELDHALEVELPFLQRACPGLAILPVAVGRATAGDVASFVDEFGALVVVSTDLSHYYADARARVLDRRTADAVIARRPMEIDDDAACGVFALRGLVEHARRNALDVELLDLRTSADTSGDTARVVGYGAFSFSARPPVD
jgi:AmmeMemoRadiSam system protein B